MNEKFIEPNSIAAIPAESVLVGRLRSLRAEADNLPGPNAVAQMVARIDQALSRLADPTFATRPFVAAIIGGTQVGKSRLFSVLIDQSGASPSSNGTSCSTSKPYIASTRSDRPLLGLPDNPPPQFIDWPHPGIALCDTPDVDGVLNEHHSITQAVIERADLIVLVTDKDKVATFDVLNKVREWAERKRWLFVLNRADLVAEKDRDDVRTDFAKHVRTMGFYPPESDIFLVSATEPAATEPDLCDDLRRLRTAILTQTPNRGLLMRRDAFLGYAAHALTPDLLGELDKVIGELRVLEVGLRNRVRSAYLKGLQEPEAQTAFRLLTQEAAWRAIAPRTGPLMAPVVMLRCRLNTILAGYQVSRLVTLGSFGLAAAAVASLTSLIRGLLPLRQVVSALGSAYRKETESVEIDSRRELEDRGYIAVRTATNDDFDSLAEGLPKGFARALRSAGDTIRRYALGSADGDVVARLSDDVERVGAAMARKTISGKIGFLLKVSANLPPTIMGGWILYRASANWYFERYQSMEFYGLALSLLAASALPGLILLGIALKRRFHGLNLADLVSTVEEPQASHAVWSLRKRLETFTASARDLKARIERHRQAFEHENEVTGNSAVS